MIIEQKVIIVEVPIIPEMIIVADQVIVQGIAMVQVEAIHLHISMMIIVLTNIMKHQDQRKRKEPVR